MKTRGDEQKQEIETFHHHKTTTTTKNSSLPRIKFRSVSNLLPCSQASKMSRSGENTSFSEDVLFESKCNYTNLDETLLSSTKNKSLKDYDRELKLLKEENFSLKLRIYMLEEEKSEREETTSSKGGTTNENVPRNTEMIDLESLSSSSTTISSPSSARTSRDHEEPTREQETGSRRRRHRQKHHESSKEDFYATDSEQKEIELENLNRINLDLEKTIETLRTDLNKKIQLIEANKKEKEHLELRFEQFRIECEHELHDKFKEQFEAELNEKLDQVSQQAYLRERELTAKLAECEIKLRELIDLVEAKNHEIEILKHERIQFVKEYKETAVKQIDSLMENLIAKENMIQFLRNQLGFQLKDALIEEVEEEEEEKKAANNDDNRTTPITSTTTTTTSTIDQLLRRTTTTSKDSSELLLITNSTSIKQQQKQKSTTSPSTSTETTPKQQHHYQFLISDLENQLRLKESLLQKYILIVRDKDAQINQLINLGLLCNKDLVNAQKLELFIAGLRSNLNDKDHLFEKSLKEHIELVRQKDELIIQSRASNVQLTADLNKANEILLESENRIEQLQSELLSSEEKRRNMESRLSEEIRKNEEIMTDYRVEIGEKDELVTKLRESLDDMKQRLKRKSDNADLVAFYEEQFHEKDNMIIEMTLKIDKLTNSLAEKINLKEEQINKLKKDGDDRLNAIVKENNQLKSELSRVNLELEKLESRFSMQVDEYEIEIENITNKLKEKENTVKSLIQSAEEKDSLIVKLKQLVAQKEEETTKSGEMDTQTSTNKTRSVKIEGLLKLVQEKNQQIDELKIELNELRARTVAVSSSMSINDLASSASLLSLSNAAATLPQPQQQPSNQPVVKTLVDALEKEILIYKRLNSLSSAAQHRNELKETLNEVETLRSELLKAASITAPETMKKQQHQVYQYQPPVQTYGGAKPKQLGSASSDNLVASKSVPTTPSKSIARPNFVTTQSPTSADLASSPSSTSTSSSQWMALGPPPLTANNQQTTDSGMDSSGRSDRAAIVRPTTRASSIPRPTNYTSPSPSSSRSSPLNVVPTGPQNNRSTSATNMQPQQLAMSASTSTLTSDELNYSGYSREELVQLVRQLASENVIIKRQIGTKAPKLTELHNEVSSVRERLAEAVKINDYLRKQIEIYHITHNNTESLLEMAQRLNLTKDELELYKEKLAKIEDLNESLLANSASNNTPRRSSNLDLVTTTNQVTASPNSAVHAPSPSSFRAKSGFGFAPDPNTIALENEIRLWKSKHQNLKEALDRSNKVSKYLSTLFAKYSPLLKELGILNKTSNLRRCLSEPRLGTQQPSVSTHELSGELKRLSSQKLSSARFDVLLSRQVSESGGRRSLEAEIDIMRPYADSSSTTLTMSEIFQAQRVQIRCDQLERQLKDRDALANDYYLRLFNIYNAFKNLKANPKYLKQMFSEPLIDSFRERLKMHRVEVDNIQSEDNLIHSIFSGAFVKFDELNKIIEEKEALINNLRCEMEKLKDLKVPKSPIDTSDDANSNFESTHNNINRKDELAQVKMREYLSRTKTNLEDVMGQLKQMNLGENKSKEFARWLESTANDLKSLDELISSSFAHSPLHFNFNLPLTDQSDSSRLFNNENNSELKTKLKKYREEIVRLKDKIKSQNKEVEEALNQLMTTNREKENTKILLSTIQSPEIDSPRSTTSTNRLKLNPNLMNSEVNNNDNFLSEKLSKTHSKLKKARDNIQTRLGEQEIFGKESESATN